MSNTVKRKRPRLPPLPPGGIEAAERRLRRLAAITTNKHEVARRIALWKYRGEQRAPVGVLMTLMQKTYSLKHSCGAYGGLITTTRREYDRKQQRGET